LPDAVSNGSIDLPITLSSADLAGQSGTPRVLSPADGASQTQAVAPVNQGINRTVTCDNGATIAITGSVSMEVSFRLSVQWGFLRASSVTFTGPLTETAQLAAAAHAGANCSLGPVPLLASPLRFSPIVFSVGSVPVVLTPTLQFYLTASGSISADL